MELIKNGEEFLDKLTDERKQVISRIYIDLEFYKNRLAKEDDEELLRTKAAELRGKLTRDKNGRVDRATGDNGKLIDEATELENKINVIVQIKEQKRKSESNLEDFELYLETVNNISDDTKEKIKKIFE